MVYVGPFETEESCAEWKAAHGLDFPVVPDPDGALFSRLTSGWVPWSLLIGPGGEVRFAENEFDENGFSDAIAALLRETRSAPSSPPRSPPIASASPAIPLRRSGPTTVVVLGGGTGGLVAAHALRKRLGAADRVVVVDRAADHLFAPSLLWLMVGERRVEQLLRPLERLRQRGIEFVRGEVLGVDVEQRRVRTSTGEIGFDYLVIALGATTAPDSVEGFAEMAHDLYSAEGAGKIRDALAAFSGGKIGVLVTSIPFKCPAAPYEAALLIDAHLRARGVRERAEIHLYTPEHQPMPVAGAALGEAVTSMLHERGIVYHPLFTFENMSPGTREVLASDGQRERVDLLIAVPPHQAPEVLRASGLLGVSGWIDVDPETLRTRHAGVYAIGDVTALKLPSGKSLPKAGVFAHGQAEVVARRIADEIRGRMPRARFAGKGYCWIETGDGRAGMAGGDFFHDPDPRLRIARPGRVWHWGKVAFEKWWLRRWL